MRTEPMNETVKILVVDDQAGMRLTLKGILSKRGYQVSMAESGEEALEAVKSTDFRVIFMDVKMPGMNGVETFIKIKEISPRASVIMMTAFAVEEEIRRAVREGAYAVLHKPFDMQKILGIIDECLENRTLVLVVDDRSQDRQLLKTILEQKGYKVVDVESGEECLRQVAERRFQIILLDVKLPGMDGLETLKQVKSLRPDVGVVLMTGHSAEELVRQAIEQGSFACLNKPYDVPKLLDIVDRCLARAEGGS